MTHASRSTFNGHRESRRAFLARCAAGGAGAALARVGGGLRAEPAAELPPVRPLTRGPKFHWFAYYDKLQFDPTGRYVLGMEVDFEHRLPDPTDAVRIGMVDTREGDRWIDLDRSQAWCWQQGCMLQWRPDHADEVVFNDRGAEGFVTQVLNVRTGQKRTLPRPVYALSPDGREAVGCNFSRLWDVRPGYGYPGLVDPDADENRPRDQGIYALDLDTGQSRELLSVADATRLGEPLADWDRGKHYFIHLLYSPDGRRIIALHRWRTPEKHAGTRMLTLAADGSGPRVVDSNGLTSHFIWRDERHILAFSDQPSAGKRFYLFEDADGGSVVPVGPDVMTADGHCTYLPGNRWILNDTYPDRQRRQHPYLYEVATGRRVALGGFYSPPEYAGEWRCDTHPRGSPDGRSVVIDSPHGGNGRQMWLIDVSRIVGAA